MLLTVIYLAFISLGLPDSLLGSAWPAMHADVGAGIAQGGFVAMTVSLCTIVSALLTARLERRLGAGRVTLFSVALTAIALFGFSASTAYWQLIAWAVPYGLGAGAVDAVLNAYVALHYEPRHMNWLHCMWGVGCSVGPLVMAGCIAGGSGWEGGYRTISVLQLCLVAVLAATLRLWKRDGADAPQGEGNPVPTRGGLLTTPGLSWAMLGFLCYCALECCCGLWAPSYMVLAKGVSAEDAAFWGSLFYIGITAGRAVSGLLTLRMTGQQLQHLGAALIAVGILLMAFGPTQLAIGIGLVTIGAGCAPIYPQMIALTPERFGDSLANTLMGPQMAAAYVGNLAFPPLAGFLIERISATSLVLVLAVLLLVMTVSLLRCDAICARERR